MKSRCRWVLLPALLFVGCGALPPVDSDNTTMPADPPSSTMLTDPPSTTIPVVEEIRGDDTAKVLTYYALVRQLTGQELAREHESARRALTKTRTDANRLRYAILLTLPGAPAIEEPRVQELLEPVTRSNDAPLRGLALLIMASLQEQRRLETNALGLQQKLDALLTLERNMTRDGSGTRKR